MVVRAGLMAAMVAFMLTGCMDVPAPVLEKSGEAFVQEKTWSDPVTAVKNCRHSKYRSECWVYTGSGQPVLRDMRKWPEETIQVGDRLGTNYRVGKDVVERWRVRSTSNRMVWDGGCLKSDPKCFWPSKGKAP